MAVDPGANRLDFVRSLLRAVIVIHSTRHYEFASCVQGRRLLSEDDIMSCFVAGRHNLDRNLRRRLTSEGRFTCATQSECLMLLARSNVLDTLPGGDYHTQFEDACSIVASADPLNGDGEVLDKVWDLWKGFQGYGGAQNLEGGNCKGFVAKNVVYQGLRNMLRALGFKHKNVSRFMSGPNPSKLASVYHQKHNPSRKEQQEMYDVICTGTSDCVLRYGPSQTDISGIDCMILQDNLCKVVEVLNTT